MRLHGLYLMSDPCPQDRLLRGHRIEGFLSSPGDPLPFEVVELDRNRLLLELLLISEDGSTLEIDDDGRPVFAPHVEPERQRAQRRAVHDGIRAYQRHLNGYRLTGEDDRVGAVDALVGRRIIERFVVEPTPEEARTFGDWEAEDDYNSFESSTLVPATTATRSCAGSRASSWRAAPAANLLAGRRERAVGGLRRRGHHGSAVPGRRDAGAAAAGGRSAGDRGHGPAAARPGGGRDRLVERRGRWRVLRAPCFRC